MSMNVRSSRSHLTLTGREGKMDKQPPPYSAEDIERLEEPEKYKQHLRNELSAEWICVLCGGGEIRFTVPVAGVGIYCCEDCGQSCLRPKVKGG